MATFTSTCSVELIDALGTDLTPVNAARVSMSKESKEFDPVADTRLIKFLAREDHWTPFGQAQVQFRCKIPISVARQVYKHQIGIVRNEESRRYIDEAPTFFIPKDWRAGSTSVKQGSVAGSSIDADGSISEEYKMACDAALTLYKGMIARGVAKEQARFVLPQSAMVEYVATGSLYAYAHMCELRIKPDAQEETREFAKLIDAAIREDGRFAHSWEELRSAASRKYLGRKIANALLVPPRDGEKEVKAEARESLMKYIGSVPSLAKFADEHL